MSIKWRQGKEGDEGFKEAALMVKTCTQNSNEEDIYANLVRKYGCSLCDEVFINTYSTNCHHRFCRRCILKWLRYCKKCPECISVISKIFPIKEMDAEIERIFSTLPPRYRVYREELKKKRFRAELEWKRMKVAQEALSGSQVTRMKTAVERRQSLKESKKSHGKTRPVTTADQFTALPKLFAQVDEGSIIRRKMSLEPMMNVEFLKLPPINYQAQDSSNYISTASLESHKNKMALGSPGLEGQTRHQREHQKDKIGQDKPMDEVEEFLNGCPVEKIWEKDLSAFLNLHGVGGSLESTDDLRAAVSSASRIRRKKNTQDRKPGANNKGKIMTQVKTSVIRSEKVPKVIGGKNSVNKESLRMGTAKKSISNPKQRGSTVPKPRNERAGNVVRNSLEDIFKKDSLEELLQKFRVEREMRRTVDPSRPRSSVNQDVNRRTSLVAGLNCLHQSVADRTGSQAGTVQVAPLKESLKNLKNGEDERGPQSKIRKSAQKANKNGKNKSDGVGGIQRRSKQSVAENSNFSGNQPLPVPQPSRNDALPDQGAELVSTKASNQRDTINSSEVYPNGQVKPLNESRSKKNTKNLGNRYTKSKGVDSTMSKTNPKLRYKSSTKKEIPQSINPKHAEGPKRQEITKNVSKLKNLSVKRTHPSSNNANNFREIDPLPLGVDEEDAKINGKKVRQKKSWMGSQDPQAGFGRKMQSIPDYPLGLVQDADVTVSKSFPNPSRISAMKRTMQM